MRISVILIVCLQLFFSCKRELTQEEKDKITQDSITAVHLAMGMNADSIFSISKYQKDLNTYEKLNDLEDPFLHDFDDYTLIFHHNDKVFYYENPFKGYWLCGTASIELRNKKMIAELYEVTKKDIKKIESYDLINFAKNIKIVDEFRPIVLAINKDQLKSKSFFQLRKYLIDNNREFQIRPTSTRERLVVQAYMYNTSDDFSTLDWDSIYKADYKRFHPFD